MPVKIKKINIEAFRGIPWLDLEPDGKSLLILGENGTGKSSLVEALEFFFTGNLKQLEGTEDVSIRRHAPHINCHPDNVKIELTFDPGNTKLERSFTDHPSPPNSLKDYFDATKEAKFILRRSQILEFILSKAGERYSSLASLIGVENLDKIEIELMRARDNLEAERKFKEISIKDSFVECSELFEKEIASDSDLLEAINILSKNHELPLITTMKDIGKAIGELFKNLKSTVNIGDKFKKLSEIFNFKISEASLEEIVRQLEECSLNIKNLLDDDRNARMSYLIESFLQNGLAILDKDELENCPFCNQAIQLANLKTEVQERLNTMRDLSEKASKVRSSSELVKIRITEIRERMISLVSKLIVIDELSEFKGDLDSAIGCFDQFIAHIDKAKNLECNLDLLPFTVEQKKLVNILKEINKKSKELLDVSELSDEDKEGLKELGILQKAEALSSRLNKQIVELNDLKTKYTLSEYLYTTFSGTKKIKVQQVYDSIKDDITHYYSILHPGESLGNIDLEIVSGRRASTKLKMDFFGRTGEHPKALASEGHLDSLGLCIFLAFVKNFNSDCSLIVLDDVVTTVDSSHRERICELLFGEFVEKQFVITTHDAIWNDQLKAHQGAYNLDNKFMNLEIIDWDLENGPQIRDHPTKLERIKLLIDQNEKRAAGNLTRQYLENVLKKLALNFRVTGIVFKNSLRYDPNELYEPTKNRLRELIKEDKYKKKLDDVFTNLDKNRMMGNYLSHDNLDADNFSKIEIRGFMDCVDQLNKTLICPDCGKDLIFPKDSKSIICSGRKCSNFQLKLQ